MCKKLLGGGEAIILGQRERGEERERDEED